MKQSETALRVVRELAGCSPFSWDPRAGTIECDAHIRRIWGLAPDAHFDFDAFRRGVHPDDWLRVEAEIARCFDPDGDGVYAVEYRVVGLDDGIERWVQVSGGTVFVDRKPLYLIGALTEVTEHKRRQEQLAESEQRFRLFAENSTDVIWIGNVEREGFDYLSPAYERIWGERLGGFEPTFRHWAQTLHPDDRTDGIAWLALLHHGEAKTLEYRIVRGDGAVREIRDAAFPIRDRKGMIRCVGGIARDVTRAGVLQVYVVGVEYVPARRLIAMLERAGYQVKHFPSPRSFLDVAAVLRPGCMLLDAGASDAYALSVLRELKAQGGGMGSIVIGSEAAGIVPAVEAMKCGASDYLGDEYGDEALLEAIASVMRRIEDSAAMERAGEAARQRIASLSAREREVLGWLLAGGSNKTIARKLGISPRTVELHRTRLMDKVGARSLQELFRVALAAGLEMEQAPPDRPGPA